MAELTINAEEVRNALNTFAESYTPDSAERVEVGHVVSAADGIAHVEGLPCSLDWWSLRPAGNR